jgi:hypothetical protein
MGRSIRSFSVQSYEEAKSLRHELRIVVPQHKNPNTDDHSHTRRHCCRCTIQARNPTRALVVDRLVGADHFLTHGLHWKLGECARGEVP